MDTPSPITWYVSRPVELPLDVASTMLDRIVDERDGPVTRSPLRMGDVEIAAPYARLPGTTCRLHGSLRAGRWLRPMAVELGLEPWSRARSELGLRPRRRVPEWRAAEYWASASAALEWLSAELLAAAPRQLASPARRAS